MRTAHAGSALGAVMSAIHVDEVGIETGRWRGYFIKSAYRPLYAAVSGVLRAVAVEAVAVPMVERQPRPLAELFETAGEDRSFLETLCLTLHVRNHANIGDDALRLVLDCRMSDMAAAADFIGTLPAHLPHTALWPDMVACIVADPSGHARDTAGRLARAARRQGLRVALADFGAGRDAPALLDAIAPDMVLVDPGLVRAVGPLARGRDLLGALVGALRASGTEVALSGLATCEERDTALAARPDLVGGPLLADARLAGSLVVPEIIDPAGFGRDDGNIVYLRR